MRLSSTIIRTLCSCLVLYAPVSSVHAIGAGGEAIEVSDLLKTSKISWLEGEQYNSLTGDFSFIHEDMRIKGNGPDLVVVRDKKQILIPQLLGTGVKKRTAKRDSFIFKVVYTANNDRQFYCRPSETKLSTDNTEESLSYTYQRPIVLNLYGKNISFYSAKNNAIKGASSFPLNADFVSADNWYLKCSGTVGLGGERVSESISAYSPDGMIYKFDVNNSYFPTIEYDEEYYSDVKIPLSIYLSSVTDPHGQSIVYSYQRKKGDYHKNSYYYDKTHYSKSEFVSDIHTASISKITADDGREVSFSYSGKITLDQKNLAGYESNGYPNKRKITVSGNKFIREDGKYWEISGSPQRAYDRYSRIDGEETSQYLVSRYTTPEGLSVSYESEYEDRSKYLGFFPNERPFRGFGKSAITTKRTLSNPNGETSVLTFRALEGDDTITRAIRSSDWTREYVHRKALSDKTGNSLAPDDRGMLLKESVYLNRSGDLAGFLKLSNQEKLRNGGLQITSQWKRLGTFMNDSNLQLQDNQYFAASRQRMVRKETAYYDSNASNKLTYVSELSEFNEYGQPKKVIESSANGVSRTTEYEYHASQPRLFQQRKKGENYSIIWKVGPWKQRQIVGIGTEYRSFSPYSGDMYNHKRNGITTVYEYNEGRLKKVTDAEGNYSEYTNYYRGIARKERDLNGSTKYRRVNKDGTILTESLWNNSNAKWTYGYDSMRRVNYIKSPLLGDSVLASKSAKNIVWTTNNSTKATTRTEKIGSTTVKSTTYNSWMQPTAETLYSGSGSIQSNWDYDALGRLKMQRLNNVYPQHDNITTFSYDGLDRVKEEKHTLANGSTKSVTYLYGISGNNLYTQRTDLRGKTTKTLFDAYGDPSSAWPININRSGVETKIDRDVVGRMKSLTQGRLTRSYGYRSQGSTFEGLLNYETNPETGTTTYGYKADGEIDYVSTGGQITYYSYHKNNQLQRINRFGDNADVTYLYKPDGLLKQVSVDNGITTAYEYDVEGKLEKETASVMGKTFTLQYRYNGYGNLWTIKYPTDRSYDLAPDLLGRPTKIFGGGKTLASNLKYWGNGVPAQASLGNSLSFRQTLTRNHLPDVRKTTLASGSTKMQHDYGYDVGGNVSSIGISGELNDSLSMTYDNVNRLATVSSGDFGFRRFAYDDKDNIDWIETNGSRSNYNYDSNNKLTSISGPLSRYGFRYDARGNTLDNGKVDLAFNAANQVTSTSDGNSYLYDGHGRRVRTTKGGKHTYNVYDQGGVLRYRLDEDKDTHSEYHYVAGKMVARRDSSATNDGGTGGTGGGTGGSGGGTSGTGAYAQSDGGVVSMEGESAILEAGSSSDRWEVQTLSGASNTQAAVAAGSGYYSGTDAGTYAQSPRLHWQVTADRSGNHDVWVRTYTKDGGTDSVHLSLDGTFKGTYWHGSADYNQWVWKKLSVSMTSGQTHTVTLWAREMGIAIDKVVLVPTGTNVPSGSGPIETTRDGSTGGSGGTGGGTGGSGGDTGGSGSGSGSSGAGAFMQGADKTVSLEAESAERTSLNGDWEVLDDTDYSNDQAVKANVTSRRDYASGPSLKWTIKAAHSGEYKVWALIRNTGENSVYTNLDGDSGFQYFASSSNWAWREFLNRKVNLTAGGEHTFEIWARDAGVEIDKVVLLPSSSPAPAGQGPVQSVREGGDTGGTGGSGGSTGGSGSGSTGTGAFIQGTDQAVSLEAESAANTSLNGTWDTLNDSSLSNDQGMSVNVASQMDYGSGPSLSWQVKAQHSGQYKVWARLRNTGGNSVYSNLDGDSGYQYFASSSEWVWREFWNRQITLTAGGEHTFEIWARDPGVEIDKVVLLPASSAAPTGEGPAESPRDGDDTGGSGGSTGGGTGSGTSGAYLQAADGIVSLEAEAATTTAVSSTVKWQAVSDTQASGDQSLKAVGGGWYGVRAGSSMAWTITGTQAGTYDVWIRGKANSGGYSVWIDWDGGSDYSRYWYGNTYGTLVWQNLPNQTVTVQAGGEHVLTLWARDGDIEIDKVVLLPAGSAAPTGEGPATSAQQ